MISLPSRKEYDQTPWDMPIAQRLKAFYAAREAVKKVAVLLYRRMDTSTFRYRCYNVMRALENSGQWAAVYFFENELQAIQELLPDISLLILTRVKWTRPLSYLVAQAKLQPVPVIFDVDDLVFDLGSLTLLTNTLAVDLEQEQAYDFWFADISRIQQAAAMAEGFIATNPYLGGKLTQKFGYPYQVIPNSLNEEQIQISAWLREKKQKRASKAPFTIGYFSGTPSHINDFLVVYKELIALLKAYPDMRLRVVGFMEFPKEMQPFIDAGQVEFIPLVDFIELQRQIAQVDVNIVPLVNNSFTNCKSELKYFEAAIVDTITVATPTYTYKNNIRHGETGFLCEPGQWYGVIEKLYKKQIDSEKICEAAREDALARYYGERFIQQVETAYNYFVK